MKIAFKIAITGIFSALFLFIIGFIVVICVVFIFKIDECRDETQRRARHDHPYRKAAEVATRPAHQKKDYRQSVAEVCRNAEYPRYRVIRSVAVIIHLPSPLLSHLLRFPLPSCRKAVYSAKFRRALKALLLFLAAFPKIRRLRYAA